MPSFPVMPWTDEGRPLVDEDAHVVAPARSAASSAASSMFAAGHDVRMGGLGEDPTTVLGVGPVEPDDDRNPSLDPLQGLQDAVGHQVAPR